MRSPEQQSQISHEQPSGAELVSRARSECAEFRGEVYPSHEIDMDLEILDYYISSNKYEKTYSGAQNLEDVFADALELDDWLGDDIHGREQDYTALTTFKASVIDDTFNHFDLIAMIGNSATNGNILPFALDITRNQNENDMLKKFSWVHEFGVDEGYRSTCSEFGYKKRAYLSSLGGFGLISRRLDSDYRFGLKMPGFASAKYFTDTEHNGQPLRKLGRIEIMPRLVVGFDSAVSKSLLVGPPPSDYAYMYGKMGYRCALTAYEDAERCAKWATLLECYNQVQDIKYMLDNLPETDARVLQGEGLDIAKWQISALDNYFREAIAHANNEADKDECEHKARQYVLRRDKLYREIIAASKTTYCSEKS